MGAMSLLIYAGALLGLGIAVSRGYSAFPLAILTYTLACSMFLTVMRYRMGIEVLLLWLAGAGFAAVLDRRLKPPRR